MERARESVTRKLDAMAHRLRMEVAADAQKRAAWEVLHGPVDWSTYEDAAWRPRADETD